jgi:prolyl oligopeptidase
MRARHGNAPGRWLLISAGFTSWLLLAGSASAADPSAPPTMRQDIQDKFYGGSVSDPYRWLEKADDPKVHDWSVAQDARARKYLDGLAQRKPIFDELMALRSGESSSFYGLYAIGDTVFAYYNEPPKQQPMLALLGNAADPKQVKVVVDPNALNAAGTTAIDWFVPSPDGTKVAVSLSDNGSEDGSLHIFDVATGKQIDRVISRVQYPTGGGAVAWRADSKGFWYTRYPGPERPLSEQHFFMKLFFHRLGDDLKKDAYVMGKGLPKVAEISLDNRQNARHLMVTVANGDGGEYAHYVIDEQGKIRQITKFADQAVAAAIGPDGAIYLVSHAGAPKGKLLKLDGKNPLLAHARTIVAQSDAVLQKGGEFGGEPVVVTADSLYVRELLGGPSRVAIFDLEGHPKGELPLPDVASVQEVEPLSDGTLLYSIETYLRPPYYSRFDPRTASAKETALAQTSPARFDDAEVVREFAKSKDGTSVPVNIVRRKGTKLDGSNPVLVTGYGGYGISLSPHFLEANVRLWLDAGGVFAVANLRGGGEFGEQWHQAGALTHKQNVFDDMIAATQLMVDDHYTTPARLSILGGSNGGLLMGACLTQHPDNFRAVVSLVGIYDMLRVELDPNGAFNTTEFGSTKDPEQFRALFAYSPYHHVVEGTRYPAVFMATGETDGRVNPAHSRKMIAALQNATASGYPVYLSINSHAGHGIGSALSIKVNQDADMFAFLMDQLDMKLPMKN